MYKVVLTHEVLPGKLAELKAWFKQQDEQRQAQDPAYTPWKRYITVFGSVHQIVIEIEMDQPPEEPWLSGYAEFGPEQLDGAQGEFLKMIVPGQSELKLWKALDLS